MISDMIPKVYQDICKCYYMEKHYPGRGEAGIIICTADGFVVKFVKGIVKNICEIHCKSAESICGFCTYEPFHKYYVIKAGSDIIIVDGGEKFEVCKKYSSVSKFAISDFTGQGFPELRIWKDNPEEFEVFNTNNCHLNTSASQNAIENVLCTKLQELKMNVMQSKQELDTKVKLRHQAIQNIQKVLEKESNGVLRTIREDSSEQGAVLPLQLIHTWDRVFEDVWVVGIFIKNVSCWVVTETNLILQPSEARRLSYTSSLFILTDNFKRSVELLPEGEGWVIGVVDMCDFSENSMNLSACLTYDFKTNDKCVADVQLAVPDFRYEIESYISGSKVPFSNVDDISEADVLSVIATSQTTVLNVQNTTSSLHFVESALTDQLKFQNMVKNYYFHKGECFLPLSGLLLRVTDGKISVYFRNEKQLCALKNCISSIPGIKLLNLHSNTVPDINTQAVMNSLRAELECVNNFVKDLCADTVTSDSEKVSDSPEFEIPTEQYLAFRERLSTLELETDLLLYGDTRDSE